MTQFQQKIKPIEDDYGSEEFENERVEQKIIKSIVRRNNQQVYVDQDSQSYARNEPNFQRKPLRLNDILWNPIPTKHKKKQKLNQSTDMMGEVYDVKADVDNYNLRGRYELDEIIQHRLKKNQVRGDDYDVNRRSKSIVPSTTDLDNLVNFPPIYADVSRK